MHRMAARGLTGFWLRNHRKAAYLRSPPLCSGGWRTKEGQSLALSPELAVCALGNYSAGFGAMFRGRLLYDE